MSAGASIIVVGIGADGWEGLSDHARRTIRAADQVIGSGYQISMLPEDDMPPHRVWPSPPVAMVDEIVATETGTICVLASGDPLHHGVGATLARRLGTRAVLDGRLSFISQASAFSLACARLGWPTEDVALVSTVGRPVSAVNRLLQPGRRIVVYVAHPDGAAQLANTLVAAGFGASRFGVLEELNSAHEKVTATTAAAWGNQTHDQLTTIAIEVVPDRPDTPFYSTAPGLPDVAYGTDVTPADRYVRAATVAALEPAPGQLLWDLGAGSGSIGIEWLRAEPSARAIAIEVRPEQAAEIHHHAETLGVPDLHVVIGPAPDVLQQLPERPDAICVSGGLSEELLDVAWERLAAGGRLVARAATTAGAALLTAAWSARGGELVRLGVARAGASAGGEAWAVAPETVQWAVRKHH